MKQRMPNTRRESLIVCSSPLFLANLEDASQVAARDVDAHVRLVLTLHLVCQHHLQGLLEILFCLFKLGTNLWACLIDLNQQALACIRQIHAVQPWKLTCPNKPLNCEEKRNHPLIISANEICTVSFRLQSYFLGKNCLKASLPVTMAHLEMSQVKWHILLFELETSPQLSQQCC